MNFFELLKSRLFVFIIIIFLLVFIAYSAVITFFYYNYSCPENHETYVELSEPTLPDESIEEDQKEEFYVEIKGAVKKQGVYKVNSDNIINDLVKLSGGFTKSAYTKNINLSKLLSKEMVIYVFNKSEINELKSKLDINNTTEEIIKESNEICNCPTYDITNCIDNGISEIVSSSDNNNLENSINSDQENTTNDTLININTASKEELMTIPGIGEKKANDIITYRNENGNFNSIGDIKNVSGIGNTLYEKIKQYITI